MTVILFITRTFMFTNKEKQRCLELIPNHFIKQPSTSVTDDELNKASGTEAPFRGRGMERLKFWLTLSNMV